MTGEPPGAAVAFSLGSNLGDKIGLIHAAAAALRDAGVPDLRLSALYRTEPWGHVTDQDWFVNACALGTTRLDPDELLRLCKETERQLGRQETVRWGPRLIDIDILFYDDAVRATAALTIPHREMMRRAFVLVPLAELAPERRIGGETIRDACARIDKTGITLMDEAGRDV